MPKSNYRLKINSGKWECALTRGIRINYSINKIAFFIYVNFELQRRKFSFS